MKKKMINHLIKNDFSLKRLLLKKILNNFFFNKIDYFFIFSSNTSTSYVRFKTYNY